MSELTGSVTERRFGPTPESMIYKDVDDLGYRPLPELVLDLDPELRPELDRLARHVFGMFKGALMAMHEGDQLDDVDVAHAIALSLLGDGYRQGE